MRKRIQRLYERYQSHHDMGSPFLEWIGVVGFIAFPLFYLLRSSASMPVLYDDLRLRIVASSMCLLLALRRFWPLRLTRYYIPYSYLTVYFCLSFLLSFTMLKNQGGIPSVVNMIMGAIIITLLADWRNTIIILMAGYAGSLLAFAATAEVFKVPAAFVISAAGTMLVVIAGALSHTAQKRAELERIRRLYAGLAGSIAHELRTPLMQARQSLESMDALLEHQGPAALAVSEPAHTANTAHMAKMAELARLVARSRVAVDQGFQAISLTLEQLNSRELDKGRFVALSAAQCIRKAVDEFAYDELDHRSHVSIEVVEDFEFRGDEGTFLLVIYNLLKNALFYLPVRPQLQVRLRIERAGQPRITVRDTGPGIAPELAGRLFQEFESAGKLQGTGLGLAFCRRAMRALDGDINCQSEPGVYTAFTLVFPSVMAPVASASGAAQLKPVINMTGLTVLVVDDSDFNRRTARARLGAFGMRTVEARHGLEALEILDGGLCPAAILMDMQMPLMDGLETTRALRARPAPGNAVPVLGLSANDLAAHRDLALAAGMNGFLPKPLDPALLQSELARVLGDVEGSNPAPEPSRTASV